MRYGLHMEENRYSFYRTEFELGRAHALDVQAWYFLGRDILVLIHDYNARYAQITSV